MKNIFLNLLIIFLFSVTVQAKEVVACVGDSITYGHGIKHRHVNSYPAQLDKLLGDCYVVKNFGVSGSTLLSKGNKPYIKQNAFKKALAVKPSIVVIKLGTNDSKPQNWGEHAALYKEDYIQLVEKFQALKSKPKIYICLPIPAYNKKFTIDGTVVKEEIIPKVLEVAEETGVTVIDLHSPFKGLQDLLYDDVHPNAKGAELIATTVESVLKPQE